MSNYRYASEPFCVEYAKSGRSTCRKCKTPIAQGSLRVGQLVDSQHFDGKQPNWFKVSCMFKRKAGSYPVRTADMLGFDELRPDDQSALLEKMPAQGDAAALAEADDAAAAQTGKGSDFKADYALSSKSRCRACQTLIKKGEVRLAKMIQSDNASYDGLVPAWHKVPCFMARKGADWAVGALEDFEGWEDLDVTDQEMVRKELAAKLAKPGAALPTPKLKRKRTGSASTSGGGGGGGGISAAAALQHATDLTALLRDAKAKSLATLGPAELAQVASFLFEGGFATPSTIGTLTKSDLAGGKAPACLKKAAFGPLVTLAKKAKLPPYKGAKGDGVEPMDMTCVGGGDGGGGTAAAAAADPFKQQSAVLWKWKDAINAVLNTKQKKVLCEANGIATHGGPARVDQRLSDALAFGVTGPCEACDDGKFSLRDDGYHCTGRVDAWCECSFATQKPPRLAVNMPEELLEELPAKSPLLKYTFSEGALRIFRNQLKVAMLAPPDALTSVDDEAAEMAALAATCPETEKMFEGKVIALAGTLTSQAEIKKLIAAGGGKFAAKVSGALDCLISTEEEVETNSTKVQQAHKALIPVVSEKWLIECVARKRALPLAEFVLVDNVNEYRSSGLGAGSSAALTGKSGKKSAAAKHGVGAVGGAGGSGFGGSGTKSMSGFVSKAKKSRGGYVGAADGEEGLAKLKVVGGAGVDPESGHEAKGRVVDSGEHGPYSATFMKTNVKTGQNSYYKMQMIADGGQWWLFTAWGRLGMEQGGSKCSSDYGSKADTIAAFKQKYLEVGQSTWGEPFVQRPGGYTLLAIDFGQDDEKLKEATVASAIEPGSRSKLPQSVQAVVQMIMSTDIMAQSMAEMEIDLTKMPLGNLRKDHILEAMGVLNQLAEAFRAANGDSLAAILGNLNTDKVEDEDADEDDIGGGGKGKGKRQKTSEGVGPTMTLPQLQNQIISCTNRFYSMIPHDTGGGTPPPLTTLAMVQEKVTLMQSLLDLEATNRVVRSTVDGVDVTDADPVDIQYAKLKTEIEPLAQGGEEWSIIEKYIRNTHGLTHRAMKIDIQQLFKVRREGEDERFSKYSTTPNHKLLWHGSRISNYGGILSQGLRIAPPEAPATGYMFGKGVYFADSVSKSANYCFATNANEPGLLLLCEVALGKEYERLGAEYVVPQGGSERHLRDAVELPADCLSTKGCGKMVCKDWTEVLPGLTAPTSKLGMHKGISPMGGSLMYNEFIVYNVDQVRVRYLVQLGLTA